MRLSSYFALTFVLLLSVIKINVLATNSMPVAASRAPTAPGLVYPVNVATNTAGVPVYQFSMKPTVTNMVAATNDLALLKAQLAEIEAEAKKNSEHGGELRESMKTGYLETISVVTNFVVQNPEGKKLNDRITALEAELKSLKQELQKKLDEDEAYKKLKAKSESERVAFKKVEENKAELRKKRVEVSTRVLQLQAVIDQVRQAEEAALKAKDKKAGTTSP